MPKDEFDHDDPMQLVGMNAPPLSDKDMLEMTRGLIDEYVRMGWADEEVLGLFRSPVYQMPHMILRAKGEEYVQHALSSVREQWGDIWQRRNTVIQPVVTDEDRGDAFVPLTSVGRFGER
ncbi:hypothetical protein HN371_04280 [Candidatus Poribacteria bacterium]|jgi:hypothetical protein|nr:hypothetical protein [Candidatus Poribacteria bacterium]MBT5536876.1 hypothetical protein [Candidatus Poribacteria bacterium]MBT5711560.1 hypothetical protein [Candidatus Poribacteria bacterium]MBT7100740.1 hypothetical protein [Candidatus Poribacteria bacterium]MBT7806684.1 hypothetical protein [Candidatus Poribacteria bacterium]